MGFEWHSFLLCNFLFGFVAVFSPSVIHIDSWAIGEKHLTTPLAWQELVTAVCKPPNWKPKDINMGGPIHIVRSSWHQGLELTSFLSQAEHTKIKETAFGSSKLDHWLKKLQSNLESTWLKATLPLAQEA